MLIIISMRTSKIKTKREHFHSNLNEKKTKSKRKEHFHNNFSENKEKIKTKRTLP